MCGVHIMKFKECFQTSLLKTLKSTCWEASLVIINQSSFQNNYQLETVWLHSSGRNAIKSGSQIYDFWRKKLISLKKKLLAFLGLLIMISIRIPLWCNWDNQIWLKQPNFILQCTCGQAFSRIKGHAVQASTPAAVNCNPVTATAAAVHPSPVSVHIEVRQLNRVNVLWASWILLFGASLTIGVGNWGGGQFFTRYT